MFSRAISTVLLACCVLVTFSSMAAAGEYPHCYPGEYPGYPGEYPCPGGGAGGGGGGVVPPPPPPGPPPPPAPTKQNAIVRLKASKVFVVDSKGRVTLGTASCPISAASCRKVRTRLEVSRRPKAKPYGTANLTIKSGQRRALRVTLSRQARRTLRRKRSLRTRIVVRSGTAKPIVRTVTLRRR